MKCRLCKCSGEVELTTWGDLDRGVRVWACKDAECPYYELGVPYATWETIGALKSDPVFGVVFVDAREVWW